MQKNTLFGLIGGLILGSIIGFIAANTINRSAINQQTTAQKLPAPNAPFQASQPASAVQTTQDGMLSQVNETLEKARTEPDNFDAQIKAAEMYAQIQKFDKAAELYEKAHKIKPDDYQTIVDTGNAYFDMKQYEAAEKWFLQALEKKPDDVNVRMRV